MVMGRADDPSWRRYFLMYADPEYIYPYNSKSGYEWFIDSFRDGCM